jgi:glutamate/tyrosine decarboxylase-like PLP-dependent enzyme
VADRGIDFLEYGPQMSRSFRALKVWMVLRHFGVSGLRRMLAKSIALAHHLHDRVRTHPDFEVLHDPLLYLYCFRYVPRELRGREGDAEIARAVDQINREIAEAVQRSGVAFVTTTRIGGKVALRMSICSQRTLQDDIDMTFDALAHEGRAIAARQLAN